ncbi:MAG: hypothetical protein EOQ56_19165 [Mesorhizobium sp.]|nr:MAG: hypothetical protein EOQ56_19165 [Mesorhizobium sp.]
MVAEAKRAVYRVHLFPDVNPEDLLDPGFWVHVGPQLRVDDRIEVVGADRAWFGEVMVLEVGKGASGGARVAYIVSPVALTNNAVVAKPADHEVRWGGPNAKWRVVRIKDKTVLAEMLDSKEEGAAWISENLKAA